MKTRSAALCAAVAAAGLTALAGGVSMASSPPVHTQPAPSPSPSPTSPPSSPPASSKQMTIATSHATLTGALNRVQILDVGPQSTGGAPQFGVYLHGTTTTVSSYGPSLDCTVATSSLADALALRAQIISAETWGVTCSGLVQGVMTIGSPPAAGFSFTLDSAP
jgi:hypothetical protein